jgi:hypothetical protein
MSKWTNVSLVPAKIWPHVSGMTIYFNMREITLFTLNYTYIIYTKLSFHKSDMYWSFCLLFFLSGDWTQGLTLALPCESTFRPMKSSSVCLLYKSFSPS